MQSEAGEIAGVAFAVMPLLSALLTEQFPVADKSTQPSLRASASPRDRSRGCIYLLSLRQGPENTFSMMVTPI